MKNIIPVTFLTILVLNSQQIILLSASETPGSKEDTNTLTYEFDEISILSKEEPGEENDLIKTQWGGNCTSNHWERCQGLANYSQMWGWEIKEEVRPKSPRYIHDSNKGKLNCTVENEIGKLCFNKTWTVSRCHILCMSLCNRELRKSSKYDKLYTNGSCVIKGLDTSLHPMDLGWNSNATENVMEVIEYLNGESPVLQNTFSYLLLLLFLLTLSQLC